jgi:hypothetical protein
MGLEGTQMVKFLLIGLLFGASLDVSAADGVGSIVFVKGDEYVLPAGPGSWQQAKFGRKLEPGDRLCTGTFGALAMLLADETSMRLSRNSEFVVEDVRKDDSETTTLQLIHGALWCRAQASSQSISRTIAAHRRPLIFHLLN